MNKILIAVPYHENKRYCLKELFDCINSLTYPNKEVLMRFDFSEYGGKDAVKLQREFFRKYALDNGFDYLYFLGADTIPPSDVIEKMLSRNLNLVGGVYWGRHNADNGNTDSAVAWINGMSLEQQKELFLKDGVVAVNGMGMDCVLIHRSILEKISFMEWDFNDDDYPFYDRCKKLGFPVMLDCSIQCRHYFGNGDTPDGYSYKAKKYFNLKKYGPGDFAKN